MNVRHSGVLMLGELALLVRLRRGQSRATVLPLSLRC